jgi:NAD(P)-dependent dehydrogenase (short-subunit alcohol dehydrogenase family)
MTARDRARGEATLQRLRELGTAEHTVHYGDLSMLSDLKRVGAEIAAAEPRIDVLINNAGAMFSSLQVTEDRLERTFALNHLSYYVLTHFLRERLVASAPARIVNTSSDAHASGDIDLDDLQSQKVYGNSGVGELLRYGGPGYKVYARSKLCNVLFTRELARRLTGTGVTANCFHPGFVATRFGDRAGGLMSFSLGIAKRFALSPAEGAKTLIYLASSPDVASVSGQYFDKCHVAAPSPMAQDDDLARQLWEKTAAIAGTQKETSS